MAGSRNIPSGLAAYLDDAATVLTELMQVTPRFGSTLRFAKWNGPLTLSGGGHASAIHGTYLARPGMQVTRTESNLRFEVDEAEASGFFYTGVVTFSDVTAGRFDGATFERILVNPEDLAAGSYVFHSGLVDEVRVVDNAFSCSLHSLMHLLTQPVGVILSLSCDVQRVGDTRCGANMAGTSLGYARRSIWTVASVSGATMTATLDSGTFPSENGFFNGGYLEFTTGSNDGIPMEVYAYTYASTTGTFVMLDRFPFTPAVGNKFQVDAGCDRLITTCNSKFSNTVNHRGFPFVIGDDLYAPGDSQY